MFSEGTLGVRTEVKSPDFSVPYLLGAVHTKLIGAFFHQKLIGDFYHLPDRLLARAWYFKEPQETRFLQNSSFISSYTASSWCYFSKRKSMA